MSRNYPYDRSAICDGCGEKGAYDIMGDLFCSECLPGEEDPPDDMEPVYATLHFYYDNPDSMRRFRKMQQIDDYAGVLFELDQWLRNKIKYEEHEEYQPARDEFWKFCEYYGIDPMEDE